MSTSVACVSALIGLNERLPQALSQISERMSESTRDFRPAFDEHVVQRLDALGLEPSSSPTGKRSPST